MEPVRKTAKDYEHKMSRKISKDEINTLNKTGEGFQKSPMNATHSSIE